MFGRGVSEGECRGGCGVGWCKSPVYLSFYGDIGGRERWGGADEDCVLQEQFVELCTMDTDGRLRRGLARHRFDAVILDATTFKHRPRPRKPSKTAAASTASAATQSLVDEMFDELIIKDEPTDSTQMGAKQLPPELLVLSLDTGDLVFAYVRQGKKGLKWVLSTKKIGAAGVREAEDKPGRKMCIDPWYVWDLV